MKREPTADWIVDDIVQVAASLHAGQALPADVLRALAKQLEKREVRFSAETGAGASTLLFSHASEHHTVFAKGAADGIGERVKSSSFLGPGTVKWIDGPTQQTLPRHAFANRLQAILLDGPHAYPFPDIEYYFLYPHIEPGGLLVLDDLHIKTVHNLFEFLRSDEMFELDEVIHRTAFFTRTDAPTFDPFADGWQEQTYNRSTLLRFTWRDRLRKALPEPVRRITTGVRSLLQSGLRGTHGSVQVTQPAPGSTVEADGVVSGTASLPAGTHLWVLARRADQDGWWPQGRGPVQIMEGQWSCQVEYGASCDAGHTFDVLAVIVGSATNRHWLDWVSQSAATKSASPVPVPLEKGLAHTHLRARRAR